MLRISYFARFFELSKSLVNLLSLFSPRLLDSWTLMITAQREQSNVSCSLVRSHYLLDPRSESETPFFRGLDFTHSLRSTVVLLPLFSLSLLLPTIDFTATEHLDSLNSSISNSVNRNFCVGTSLLCLLSAGLVF